MYPHTTLKRHVNEERMKRNSWFTLVEIMIVIVIIVLLTQLGNIGGLFRTRERNKVEEIAVKVIAAIDEEKINALLGKTLEGKIIRKRLLTLNFTPDTNTLKLITEINLAEDDEDIYDVPSKITKSWNLAGLIPEFYSCWATADVLNTDTLEIEFQEDVITFLENPNTEVPNHIVLLLKHTNTAHEIHIDRRTGLTFEKKSSGKNEDWTWQIICN